jgi:hypothetical protein
MRVYLCTPTDRPHLTGATPDLDEALEMARALMLCQDAGPGSVVRLQVGEMSVDEFEAAPLYPLEHLPCARFAAVVPRSG